MRFLQVTVVVGIVFVSAICPAQETLPTPREVMARIEQTAQPTTATTAPAGSLEAQAADFKRDLPSLAPADAASRWLDLLDKALREPARITARRDPLQPGKTPAFRALEVIPPPTIWPELDRQASERLAGAAEQDKFRLLLERMLTGMLVGDVAGLQQDLRTLADLAAADQRHPQRAYQVQQLAQAITALDSDPSRVVGQFEASLEAAEKAGVARYGHVAVPDLVTLVGPDKARALVRRALLLPAGSMTVFQEGDKTKQLARIIAIESIDELRSAPWTLTEDISPDAVKLYEALDAKFPRATTQAAQDAILTGRNLGYEDQTRTRGRAFYVLGLIANDRADDAAKVFDAGVARGELMSISYEAMDALSRGGRAEQVWQFLHARLQKDPSLPVWNLFIQLSAQVGKTAQMIELARTAAEKPDLAPAAKAQVFANLYSALFAADEIEEGIEVARRVMNAPDAPQDPAPIIDPMTAWPTGGDASATAALRLARVGLLLQRPQLTDEALDVAAQILKRQLDATPARPSDGYALSSYLVPELARVYVEAGRSRQAVDLLTATIGRVQRSSANSGSYTQNPSGTTELVNALVEVYHRAEMHQQVLELLRTFPYFDADDLRDVLVTNDFAGMLTHADPAIPLGTMAAVALARSGQRDAALAVTRAMIERSPGHDPVYELLIEIEGDAAIEFLGAVYERDRFQERPLIWKAELLRRAKRLDDAEKIVRQAISIDPSDGEQPRGDRMRAYAVLADILADKGDQKNAQFFREVGAAIRLAEEADRYFAAGLLTRAVKLYQQSLEHFADAYCIQSRLAIQLAQLGRLKEAEEHYQRAYELMPDSFGRVESHCFGCEGVFQGQLAQGIAERVFTRLAQANPQRPQVHYLLGYLRQSQQRYIDAADSYRAATRLDPDYLNAWKALIELRDRIRLPAAETDAAALNLLRLDPLGRHTSVPWQSVSNLRALWALMEVAAELQFPATPPLFDLTAARARREAAKAPPVQPQVRYYYSPRGAYTTGGLPRSPQEALAGHSVISQLLHIAQSTGN